MKAILVKQPGGPEQLYIGTYEKPLPNPDELLVRVHATALNRADTLQRQGKYPPPKGASPLLGLEVAGYGLRTYVLAGFQQPARVVVGKRVLDHILRRTACRGLGELGF